LIELFCLFPLDGVGAATITAWTNQSW